LEEGGAHFLWQVLWIKQKSSMQVMALPSLHLLISGCGEAAIKEVFYFAPLDRERIEHFLVVYRANIPWLLQ
jgi:hypothetical protein